MIAWLAELSELDYRLTGTRRGRLLLAHPRTGWRISLPSGGPACDLHRAILCRGAVPRPTRSGVAVQRAAPHRPELIALMTRKPVPR